MYVKFLKYLIALPKSRQPQSQSFTILKDSFYDSLMKAKLKFLEFVSNKLNKFLRGYQTDQPMVPFLCNSLKEILTSLIQMFIVNDNKEGWYNVEINEDWCKSTQTLWVDSVRYCYKVACNQLHEKHRFQRKCSPKIL